MKRRGLIDVIVIMLILLVLPYVLGFAFHAFWAAFLFGWYLI